MGCGGRRGEGRRGEVRGRKRRKYSVPPPTFE